MHTQHTATGGYRSCFTGWRGGRDGRLVGDERVNGAAELVPGAHEYD